MSNIIDVNVPDIGDFKNIPIIEIMVKPGDKVDANAPVILLESDKATLDVPAPVSGVVKEVFVKLGDKMSQGGKILALEVVEGAAAPLSSPAPAPVIAAPAPASLPVAAAPSLAVAPVMPVVPVAPSGGLPHASPSVRHYAYELGVDLAKVRGSGPKGRILREDVIGFVKAALAAPVPQTNGAGLGLLPWPEVDFAKYGEIERVPLSNIRRISGANLSRNAVVIPHVTNFDEADVTDLESFRNAVNAGQKQSGTKVTMLAFIIKAVVAALRKHPHFNASLEGEQLVLKRYFHIGFAADTPNGLLVPVIRDADRKGILELAAEMSDLAAQARAGKLKPADMQGGCFTISSLGGIGGNGFTPIINAPEVAILGAAKAKMQPVWDGTQFLPRLIMPLNLSWDHRVVDGAEAARFLVTLTGLLADFRRISL